MDTPGDVIEELRQIWLEANPHVKQSIDERAQSEGDDYELKKVVLEDGTVTKQRETAPGTKHLYSLFGPARRKSDGDKG